MTVEGMDNVGIVVRLYGERCFIRHALDIRDIAAYVERWK